MSVDSFLGDNSKKPESKETGRDKLINNADKSSGGSTNKSSGGSSKRGSGRGKTVRGSKKNGSGESTYKSSGGSSKRGSGRSFGGSGESTNKSSGGSSKRGSGGSSYSEDAIERGNKLNTNRANRSTSESDSKKSSSSGGRTSGKSKKSSGGRKKKSSGGSSKSRKSKRSRSKISAISGPKEVTDISGAAANIAPISAAAVVGVKSDSMKGISKPTSNKKIVSTPHPMPAISGVKVDLDTLKNNSQKINQYSNLREKINATIKELENMKNEVDKAITLLKQNYQGQDSQLNSIIKNT